MAKKHKKRKVGSHHRRRRVGAAKGVLENLATKIIGVSAGALAGAFAIQAGNTMFGITSGAAQQPAGAPPEWIIPAGVFAAGVVLPLVAKGSEAAEDFGMGLMAAGALFTVNATAFSIPGISGMAMSSNASAYSPVFRKAVGSPTRYINKTVGKMSHNMSVGALISD